MLHVNVGQHGLATGLTYIDELTGELHEQPADIVNLSGIALSNVRMMLVSRSSTHLNGIGNDRGLVGKNFTYQLVQTPVIGIFEGHRFNLFTGNAIIANALHDYNTDNFDHSALDFIGGGGITCGNGERQPLTRRWQANLAAWQDKEKNGDSSGRKKTAAESGEVHHSLQLSIHPPYP